MNWQSLLIGGGFGASLAGGIVALVKVFIQRPLIQASAAGRLSESALKLIAAAQKAAERAEAEADQARQEAAEARKEAADARRSADEAERAVRYFRAAILSPAATLESLRQMAAEGPGNGVARPPSTRG